MTIAISSFRHSWKTIFAITLRLWRRSSLWLFLAFCGAALDGAKADLAAGFKKGININHLMSYPAPTGWPRFVSPLSSMDDREFKALRDAGFDHVRLLVDPEIFLQEPNARDGELWSRFRSIVRRIHKAGLNVIAVNFTRHTAKVWQPERIFTALEDGPYLLFRKHTVEFAKEVARLGTERTRFVIASEPQKDCKVEEGLDWTVFQRDLYRFVRREAPTLTLGLTGGCWSGIDGLATLEMKGFDRNTFVDVHFYSPFVFTHQGETLTLPAQRYVAGLPYPSKANDAVDVRSKVDTAYQASVKKNRQAKAEAFRRAEAYLKQRIDLRTIEQYFSKVEAWRKQQNITADRIAIGEFGAMRSSIKGNRRLHESRLNWLRDTRRVIEKLDYSWSMWDYFPPFSLLEDVESRRLDQETLKALGLKY